MAMERNKQGANYRQKQKLNAQLVDQVKELEQRIRQKRALIGQVKKDNTHIATQIEESRDTLGSL